MIYENFKNTSSITGVRLVLAALLFAAIVLASCADGSRPQSNSAVHQIKDELGRSVKVSVHVKKAVSLAPNLTEIIFAVGAGDKLVGVTSYCNYPERAKDIPKVGDTLKPNIENILALKPDVVFVSTASQLQSFSETLEKQGISVFVTNPNSLEDIYNSIEKIGEVFGNAKQAEEVVTQLKKRVREIEEKTKNTRKIRTFVQIDRSLYTIGEESFLTDLIEKAGGSSVTKDVATAYPKISKEKALALDPEAIILSESPDNISPNDAFKNSSAIRNGRVYKINADILSRPAPRIVDALEQIAKSLHPEKFQ
ncbi:MAG: cobalamin-binding protein [Acidobacteria bacterium]|nr:cobalamin-binding protein [Acidobacteriota bacterium]